MPRWVFDPYWVGTLPGDRTNFIAWQNANAYLAGRWEHRGWRDYAALALVEARKYGKPLYPFIWPMFHDNAKAYLPPDYGQKNLPFENADGVVIGDGGGFLHETWDNNAPWWQAALNNLFCK